jgi:hypothetical protein
MNNVEITILRANDKVKRDMIIKNHSTFADAVAFYRDGLWYVYMGWDPSATDTPIGSTDKVSNIKYVVHDFLKTLEK